jgi:hypothetical protein
MQQTAVTHTPSEPPAISPDQILEHAPRKARILRVDANVLAYFGDMFHAVRHAAVSSKAAGGPRQPR